MSVRDDIYALLGGWDLELPPDLNDGTPLFDSGLFDSLALFNLVVWIEKRVGQPVDPSQLDLRREWATIGDIVRFIEQRQDGETEPEAPPTAPTAAPAPSLPGGYRVERYRPELKAHVAELQTGLWSPDVDLNTRYFEWKYERCPYAHETPCLYLLFFRDELVGMRGFSESRWEVGTDVETVLVADDLLVRDDHRGRGLVTHLMRAAFTDLANRGFVHLFNLSASPVNIMASLAMGWKSVGALEPEGTASRASRLRTRGRAAIRDLPAVWRYARSPVLYSRSERAPFRGVDRRLAKPGRHASDDPAFSRLPRLAEIAELIARQPHDGRIRHRRDLDYLAWRYENPLQDYRFLHAGGERLDGFVAMSRSIASYVPRVTIADIEAVDDTTFVALLDAASRSVRNLYVWTATLDPGRRATLRRAGFSPVDRRRTARGCPCILVNSLSEPQSWELNGLSLLDMRSWDVRMLYSTVA